MAKERKHYVCQQCGSVSSQWAGRCTDCSAWNSLVEQRPVPVSTSRRGGYTGEASAVQSMKSLSLEQDPRHTTHSAELDRVLGGGLVPGSVILLGGDPGIGKSTLLLQCCCQLHAELPVLYVTGEESLQQVALRASRLNDTQTDLRLLAETQVERILAAVESESPKVLVIDSIQTLYTELVASAPGSVSQLKESVMQLVRLAKARHIALLLVGHVTKEGQLAGPRVVEHMVDAVLYFEGDTDSRFRIIRAVKNRFGAVNELGVFAMTDRGLREVSNPSAIFLSRQSEAVPGSVVMVTWEGSRPMLVEVQALVDESHGGNPRRLALGLEQNRLAMLLAVLHRHGAVATYDQDVFINVVGGVRITEPGIDLALLLAVVSSLKDKAVPLDWVVFGEVGLAGEIRPVASGQERLKEAAKHGFKKAVVPAANAPRKPIDGMEVIAVSKLSQALAAFREL